MMPYLDTDLSIIYAQIHGPEDSPYENGIFELTLRLPENYPFEPPEVKFLTSIYHPNIDNEGRVSEGYLTR